MKRCLKGLALELVGDMTFDLSCPQGARNEECEES